MFRTKCASAATPKSVKMPRCQYLFVQSTSNELPDVAYAYPRTSGRISSVYWDERAAERACSAAAKSKSNGGTIPSVTPYFDARALARSLTSSCVSVGDGVDAAAGNAKARPKARQAQRESTAASYFFSCVDGSNQTLLQLAYSLQSPVARRISIDLSHGSSTAPAQSNTLRASLSAEVLRQVSSICGSFSMIASQILLTRSRCRWQQVILL